MPREYGRFDGFDHLAGNNKPEKSYLCAVCDFAVVAAWASMYVLGKESKVCVDCIFPAGKPKGVGDVTTSH